MSWVHSPGVPHPKYPTDMMTSPLIQSFIPSHNADQLYDSITSHYMKGPQKIASELTLGHHSNVTINQQWDLQMQLFYHNHVAEDLKLAYMDLGTARWATTRLLLSPPSNTPKILAYPNMNSPDCLLTLRAAIKNGQQIMDREFIIVGLDLKHFNTKWEPKRLYRAQDWLLTVGFRKHEDYTIEEQK